MKHVYLKTRSMLLLAGLLITNTAFSQESLNILTGDIKLVAGDSIQLTAEYYDADSVIQEVSINWYTEPADLATVNETGLLKAQQAGKGFLYANYNELLDSVEIEIEAVEEEEIEDGDSTNTWGTLVIINEEIVLNPGESVQPEAEYSDTTGAVMDVKIKWNIDPGYLGNIDRNGQLTARHPGEGMLFAKYRDLRDSIPVKVNGIPKNENEEDSIDYPKVKVVPGMIRLAAGDSVELVAFYINENDEKVDTSFSWSVWPAELGMFPDSAQNKFIAGEETGKGVIIATLGDLADTVKLMITEPKDWPRNGETNGRRIIIEPGDTVVNAGDLTTLQYTAQYKANGKNHENVELEWSISGAPVGAIDSTGLLTLSGETGLALIKAEYSNFSASVELLVVDSLADTEINSITVHRILPDGYELPAKSFNEGGSYKIGGLPFPLNILNGGMLHFPFGCISEDIVIYMFIPEEYAEVDEDSAEISFNEEIITGIKFNVKPADSADIVEPYYFNVPINLSMVFKHELLDSLGVSPEDLDVFFADNTGFVADGTDHVAIDTARNKIHAAIEHFSTIVVRPKSAITNISEVDKSVDNILNIYPNPFRNSTRILFKVESKANVAIELFNMNGQKVTGLANRYYTRGIHSVDWNGTNASGNLCNEGIYFCRITIDGKQSEVKKLILQR